VDLAILMTNTSAEEIIGLDISWWNAEVGKETLKKKLIQKIQMVLVIVFLS
jgi:demethylmenaquinone methyltransferase/2-methoxy-6-polyprenyl-1,4-benzoquinol methylase